MVAPIVDINGEQIGSHLTYAWTAGLRKELRRETRGVACNGVVKLCEYDPDDWLVIAEGVESALSAAQILVHPSWSAISAGNLKRLDLPEAVRRIIIAADNDIAGINAAHEARRRWVAEGRRVRVAMPSRPGEDFNDVLRGGGK